MKPDIFEIFRTFSRYLEKNFEIFRKKLGISGKIFRRFFVIFVSRPTPSYICDLLQVLHPNRNLRCASKGLSLVEPNHQTQAYGARSFFVAAPTLASRH